MNVLQRQYYKRIQVKQQKREIISGNIGFVTIQGLWWIWLLFLLEDSVEIAVELSFL